MKRHVLTLVAVLALLLVACGASVPTVPTAVPTQTEAYPAPDVQDAYPAPTAQKVEIVQFTFYPPTQEEAVKLGWPQDQIGFITSRVVTMDVRVPDGREACQEALAQSSLQEAKDNGFIYAFQFEHNGKLYIAFFWHVEKCEILEGVGDTEG